MRLAEIRVFPVKSCGGVTLGEAVVEACGLVGDRRWMVVDAAGRMVTQREVGRLAVVRARPDGDGLVLGMAGFGEMRVAVPEAGVRRVKVSVWRDSVWAAPARAAEEWLSAALGVACRLVHLDDVGARACRSGVVGETVRDGSSYSRGVPKRRKA